MISVADLPDIDSPETVRQLGADIKWIGSRAADLMGSATEIWSGLRNTYSAPEASKLHAAMRQPNEIASELQRSTSEAKKNLDEYADKLSDFEKRKESLKQDIESALADLSYAESLPETVTETDADGETHEEPNTERDALIAAAEQKLSELAAEVEKLRGDLKDADSDLASRFLSAAQGDLNFATALLALGDPEARDAFTRGMLDWLKDTIGLANSLVGPFGGFGPAGIALGLSMKAWQNRDRLSSGGRSLSSYLTASPEKRRYMNEQLLGRALTWGRSKYVDFLYDPGHSLGYLAPDVLLSAVTGGSSGAARAAGSGAAKNLAEAGVRAGARDVAEAASSAAARGAGKPAARSGAGASGKPVLKDANEIVPETTPHPNGGSRGTNSTSTVSPANDVEVQNSASTPAEPPVAGANGVHTGAETVTAYGPPTPKPGNNQTLTLREQLDQAWREAEKPTQRIMTDLEYTNTRRRADLAARYEALGDPSTAAAVRYLYNADTVRNLHSAVLEDPTFLKDFKLGIDDISFSPNNSIAPNVESRFTEVVGHYATDAPLGRQQGPVLPPDWKVDRPKGHVPTPDAIVIDSISTRTRHARLQWEHYADADLNRSFHVEDGKVLGNKNDSGNFSDVFKDGDYRKDGKAARASIDEVVGNARDSVGDTKFDAGHSMPGPLAPNIGPENFTPQNPNLNRGSLNQFEKFVQSFVESPQGGHVRYESAAHLDEFGIPTDYDVHVLAKANATGETIVDFAKSFENTAGRQFSLNPETLGATDQPDLRPSNIAELFDAATGGKDN